MTLTISTCRTFTGVTNTKPLMMGVLIVKSLVGLTMKKNYYDRRYRKNRLLTLKANPYCVRCGADTREVGGTADHIVPISQFGSNDLSNLQTMCASCNFGIGDKTKRNKSKRITRINTKWLKK